METIKQNRTRVIANTLYVKSRSGASLNYALRSPKTGYMVGGYVKPLIVKNKITFNISKLESWIDANKLRAGQYYGVWTDKEKNVIVFDVSKRLNSKTMALSIGKRRNEQTIYDVVKGKEISCKTGLYL